MLDIGRKRKDEIGQLELMIHKIRKDHPSMGLRDLYFKLQPSFMGRDRFEQFCKENGYMLTYKKTRCITTDSSGVKRFENHIKDMEINGINQVWQSDITYYQLGERFYYLTFILDSYSRRVLGYSASKRLLTDHTTLPALRMALRNRKNAELRGLIFHSDGGGQYYAKQFLELTNKHKIINSMCEYAYENGKAERLNGVIKNNYLRYKKINSYQELVKEVDHAVLMYNKEKPHIKLGRKSPIQYENNLLFLQKQETATMRNSFGANILKNMTLEGVEPSKDHSKKTARNQNLINAKMICFL